MPGMTMPSEASISYAPSGDLEPGPTPAIRSPTTSTSASAQDVVRVVHGQHGAAAQHDRPAGLDRGGSRSWRWLLLRSGSGTSTSFGPPAARRWRSHAPPTSRERDALDVDDDVAAGDVLGRAAGRPSRAHARAAGGRPRSRARRASFERMSGRGQGDARRRRCGRPGRGGRSARRRLMAATRGLAPQLSIVTSTSPPAASRMALGEVVARVELDDRVGAALEQPLEPLAARGRPRRRGRRRAASPTCTATLPDRAGRAEHEHRLAGLQARRATTSASQAAEAGVAERRGHGVVDARRRRRAAPSARHERALGHRAVGRDGRVEVHAPAVRRAGRRRRCPTTRRQRRRAHVERARRLVAGRGGAGPRRRRRPRRGRPRRGSANSPYRGASPCSWRTAAFTASTYRGGAARSPSAPRGSRARRRAPSSRPCRRSSG